MMVIAINLLIGLYRAFPLRPHCDARHGVHTFLCRMIMPFLAGLGPECDFPSPPNGRILSCGEQRSNRPNWKPNPRSH